MGYLLRGNPSVFHLLQVSRYCYLHGILLPLIFLSVMFSSFNFPKCFEMFDIKSNTCYKIGIGMSHWNLHVIVHTKTFTKTDFKPKQISYSHTVNKVKWESKRRSYECLQRCLFYTYLHFFLTFCRFAKIY